MNILEFSKCSYKNKQLVGGKCSSLGELFHLSKKYNFFIADGFATTTIMFDQFIESNNLTHFIKTQLVKANDSDIKTIERISNNIKNKIMNGLYTNKQIADITIAYNNLCKKYDRSNLDVAIRSSAVAEDLANASFAGQQDTFLNIRGIDDILKNIKKCIASLFNTRAISYRQSHKIKYKDIKISVAIQKMVRSDLGSAGVAFSIDPDTGYDKAIIINSSYGLGELVVSGHITPDEIICNKNSLENNSGDPIIMKKLGNKTHKIIYTDNGIEEITTSKDEQDCFSITDEQAISLSKTVLSLEQEYSELNNKKMAIDTEWAIDGIDNQIYIVQSRPETIHSNKISDNMDLYVLDEVGNKLITGIPIGNKISTGNIKILQDFTEAPKFNKGDILVTTMTTPDWEPIMKISSGIITNKGGRTCHAAIITRELGINAIIGTTNATEILQNIKSVTMDCTDNNTGIVYNNKLKYHIDHVKINKNQKLPIKLMMNIANPESCFSSSLLPNDGVGLVRLEFIINNYIQLHPSALINYPNNPPHIKNIISNKIKDTTDAKSFFVKELSRGIGTIASAFYPDDVIIRFSDFKSNEYKNLVGGDQYEPSEENPMIGWRGASRYYSDDYKQAFELECQAIKYVRNEMNLTNVIVMIPFCRTVNECKEVLSTMESFGLKRGENNLQVYLMCEIPSNVIEANEFSPHIDGVSIGGNDLLQLTLGIDRDNEKIAYLSNDQNLSYRRMIQLAIKTYKKNNIKIGFCGQQPSDSIEFCKFLINSGIDSISVTPDSVLNTINNLNISRIKSKL